MSKSGKILAVVAVVVVLAAAGGILWLSSAMDNLGSIKIEVEEVPCGLEWGMTMEEARTVMESAGYIEQECSMRNVLMYLVPAYQGQYKARCNMLLNFNKRGALEWVYCRFEKEATEAIAITEETLDELEDAFKRVYEKKSEEILVDPDPIAAYEYCLMERTLVSFMRNGTAFMVVFEDREAEDMPEYIEALREEFGK
ncbi:MAG: hypothetical protein E7292_00475 [Lachnospiraceae bacterium]|nr:hypothetical protein [Lachnospiraceae bacterium]